jgi:DNA mismatch endonuclease, patch repair protein
MADIMTAEERSHRMSLIRSRDTGPELSLRRALHGMGMRYRIHVGGLPGRPDIVFPSARAIVFVNGCFWHGHRCKTGHIPKSNSAFWRNKVETNRARDARNIHKLRQAGWKVIVVWECELRNRGEVESCGSRVAQLVKRRRNMFSPVKH